MDLDRLIELRDQGLSQREIAEGLGVSQQAVSKVLRRLPKETLEELSEVVQPRSHNQVFPFVFPPPGPSEILGRYLAGESVEEIAEGLEFEPMRFHPDLPGEGTQDVRDRRRSVRSWLYRQKWEAGLIGPAS